MAGPRGMITVVALSTVLEVSEEETRRCAMKEAPDGNAGTRKAKGEHNDIQKCSLNLLALLVCNKPFQILKFTKPLNYIYVSGNMFPDTIMSTVFLQAFQVCWGAVKKGSF